MKYLILISALFSYSAAFAADMQAICTNTSTGAQLKLIKIDDNGNGRFEMNNKLIANLESQPNCQKVISQFGGTFGASGNMSDKYMFSTGAELTFSMYTQSARGGVLLKYMDETAPTPNWGPNFQFNAGECTDYQPVPNPQPID